MASNTSQSKALSILYEARIAEYATWSLIVSCKPCGVVRTIQLATLPPELTMLQAMMRMRCRTCRGRVEKPVMDNQVPGWRARLVQVWGPGSYG